MPKRILGYADFMARKLAAEAVSLDGSLAMAPAPTKGAARARAGSAALTATAAAPPVKRAASTVRKSAVKAASAKRGAPRPADDPLAPERTRYVVQLLGSGQKLAGLMGVSPSQPSRWASGDERPSMAVAPLLIDLEHVLARVRLVWSGNAAVIWLESANVYLGGSRPIDVLRMQGPGPVLEALDAAAWGGAA